MRDNPHHQRLLYQAGGQSWETLVADEFLNMMAERFKAGDARVVIGASMGGYGALKIAFREPPRYVAVAAMCPAIWPAEIASAVEKRKLPSIPDDLDRTRGMTMLRIRATLSTEFALRTRSVARREHVYLP